MNVPALRAVGRIARRSARRNLRASLLVVVMVALPVALVVAGATVARTVTFFPREVAMGTMGAADFSFSAHRTFDPAFLAGRLPAGSEVVVTSSQSVSTTRNGSLIDLALIQSDHDLDDPMFRGLYALRSGLAPSRAGEVALSEELLNDLGKQVGDAIRLGGHSLRITGIAEAPFALDRFIGIVGPGTLGDEARSTTVLVDVPASASVSSFAKAAHRDVGVILARSDLISAVTDDAAVWDAVALSGGVVALFATGLIASAAFVVGARRQLRELGLVGAIGGERSHVRAVVLLGGTTLGVIGGIIGIGGGIGIALALHPFLDDLVGRDVGPTDVNVFVLAGAASMAIIAATIAALAPSRAAARLSTVEALAARTRSPRPPGRVAGVGLLAVGAGAGLTGWATVADETALIPAGLIAMLLGVLLGIPLLVTLVGRVSGRLPLTVRLASRDAARHGRRTGAAVAAAVIALCIPVAVATYTSSEEAYESHAPVLGDDQLLIGALDRTKPARVQALLGDARETFPSAVVAPLTQAALRRKAAHAHGASVWAHGVTDDERDRAATISSLELFVGDADLLSAVHAEEGAPALADGKAVVLGGFRPVEGSIRVQGSLGGAKGFKRSIPAVAIDSPSYFNESLPKIVISRATARGLGLRAQASQYLITAASALSGEDVEAGSKLAARHPGFFVTSAKDYVAAYALVRNAATSVSLALALAILAVAIALVASETRRSKQLLVAVGAGPVAHKRIAAATAGLLALIASLLAVPAGLFPTVVIQMAGRPGRPIMVPWLTVAEVVLVTPIVAAAVAGLLARAPKVGRGFVPAV